MRLSRHLWRRAVRETSKSIVRTVNRRSNYRRIQREAAERPESTQVATASGDIWMSPIEVKLFEAMQREGLSPKPQYCIEGYFVDFAFPDVRVAVEADGAPYHEGERREHDRKRDWVLERQGWKVLRFHGSTIHERASNCAYIVKREIQTRR